MLWRQIRLWPRMNYSQGFNYSLQCWCKHPDSDNWRLPQKGVLVHIGPASIADKSDSGQESISDLSQGFVSSNGKIRCLWPMKLGMLQGCFKKGCWRIIGRVRGELNLRIDAVQESKLKSSQEQTSKAWIFPNYWNQIITRQSKLSGFCIYHIWIYWTWWL